MDWALETTLIGYFPKRRTPKPEMMNAPRVREICSVSGCVAEPPDRWIDRWTHNAHWVYNSFADATHVIPEDDRDAFDIYAYRLLPAVFERGTERQATVPTSGVEALPASFAALGFDVVSRSTGTTFECSPLSCSGMAADLDANEYCLLPTLTAAREAAIVISRLEPEPGPYVVVEVLRG